MIRILYEEFETYCREQLGLSENSLRAYRQDLKAFARFASLTGLQDKPTHDEIISFQKHLREEDGVSPSTIRRRMVTLRSYFKWMCDRDGISGSPFDGLRLDLKVPRRLPRPVDRQTLGSMFRSSKPSRDFDPIEGSDLSARDCSGQVTGLVARLLVVTGMRVGEVTNLLTRDVSGAGSRIRVRGKGNRERTVYVTNPRLLHEFRLYWEKRIGTDGPNAPLFLNSQGEAVDGTGFPQAIADCVENAPHRTASDAASIPAFRGDAPDRRGRRHQDRSAPPGPREHRHNRYLHKGFRQFARRSH
jgi:integrase/recombinase XerD